MPHWVNIAVLLFIACTLIPIPGIAGCKKILENWIRNRLSVPTFTILIFLSLVGLGLTGSSIALLTQGTASTPNPIVSSEGKSQIFAGKPRGIRSDEWGVITPLAIAQKNHTPSFPVVNSNMGPDGQNMLIVGMAGAPVKHITAISKPATWGFFFLPTQAAMGWYWYFPFFACFLSLFLLLETIAPGNRIDNLGLSLIFCIAPYAAGWSNWPLYAVFFPTAMSLVLFRMLTCEPSSAFLWWQAILLGLLTAGFFLVLYPPWQISLASFYTLLMTGFVADNRHRIQGSKRLAASFAASALVAVIIVLAWWLDARDAVEAIRATVYPGHRDVHHGADTPPAMLLWGYSNLETLPNLYGSHFNESEFSSYFFLFPAIFYLLLLGIIHHQSARKWLMIFCLIFLCLLLIYCIFGFPRWLANAMLWNHVPAHRSHVALGLASIVAIALANRQIESPASTPVKFLIAAMITMTGLLINFGISTIPENFFPGNSTAFRMIVVIIGIILSLHLARGRFNSFIVANIILYAAATWFFNPISKAPVNIILHEDIKKILSSQQKSNNNQNSRVFVISNETIQAMGLVATGHPVANATFYYPQKTFWKNFDLTASEWKMVNRYQHLISSTEKIDQKKTYEIANISVDTVKITIDSLRFDFNRTGAGIVASRHNDDALKSNPSLDFLATHNGWDWYSVKSLSAQ
ncbi:MAG: hypothetical protein KBH33_03770 [Alicycliphilus sp.]|jgi:hypothetical protein|nr:hypothetical protein [Alicycliphilus sp.]